MTPQTAVGAGLGGLAAAGAGGTGIAYAAGAFEKPKEPDRSTTQGASGGTTQTEQAGSRGTAGVSQEKAKEGVGSPEAPVGSGSNIVVQPESARGEEPSVADSLSTGNPDGAASALGEKSQTGLTVQTTSSGGGA